MQQYNVFTDFHHGSLLKSFILLFEKRLGGKVYRPIGTDWATQGYWHIYDHPSTIEQFLGIGGATPDGTQPLNEVIENPTEGLYHCRDIEGDQYNKAITLDLFYKLPIDIVIASIPAHIEPFKRLAQSHPNKPKFIYQIGNAWTIEAGLAPNIMASAIINSVPEDVHFISYHQEFDTDIFKPGTILADQNIYSFVNVFNGQDHFASDWKLFTELERELPDWNFKSYGGQCRDGSCNGSRELASKMQEARFIWHTKAGGDGYGHVIHNAAAMGKPMIVKKNYYQGKLAEKLLIDDVTCINIDNLGHEEIINKIKYFNEEQRYSAMSEAVYENFKKVCNFDQEFIEMKQFLENLA